MRSVRDDPARPGDLLALIDEGFAQANGYLIIAIKTGVAVDRPQFVDRAYGFLKNGMERQRWDSLYALGQIEMLDASDWERLLKALGVALAANPGDEFRAYFLSAIGERLKGAPGEWVNALEALAVLALSEGGEHTRYSASRMLASYPERLSAPLKAKLLAALREVDVSNNLRICPYGSGKI